MDLGWNVWLTENTFDLSEDFKEMELDRGRSVNFHLGVIQQGVNLYKGKLRLVYGLGIEYNNYRFKEDIDLQKDSDPLTYALNTDRDYRKNKLVSLHATVPFMLNFGGLIPFQEDAWTKGYATLSYADLNSANLNSATLMRASELRLTTAWAPSSLPRACRAAFTRAI